MLDERAARQLADLYARLTPWQRTQVARHPDRPRLQYLVDGLFDAFMPLSGDRAFADDQAIIGGFARFEGRGGDGHRPCQGRGHRFAPAPQLRDGATGKDTAKRSGCLISPTASRCPSSRWSTLRGPSPALRPRRAGQGEAIARCTERCLSLGVPLIAVIVGEGGSGGAVALAAAQPRTHARAFDLLRDLPEGCASILWRDSARAARRRAGDGDHRQRSVAARRDSPHRLRTRGRGTSRPRGDDQAPELGAAHRTERLGASLAR